MLLICFVKSMLKRRITIWYNCLFSKRKHCSPLNLLIIGKHGLPFLYGDRIDRKESIQVHLPKQNSTKSLPNAERSWLRLLESSILLHLPRFFLYAQEKLATLYTANIIGFCDFPTSCRLRSSAQMGAMYISMVARIVLIHRRWPTAILGLVPQVFWLYHISRIGW